MTKKKEEAFDYLESVANKVTKTSAEYISYRLESLYGLLFISDDTHEIVYEVSDLIQLLKFVSTKYLFGTVLGCDVDQLRLCLANILIYIQGKAFLARGDRRVILDSLYMVHTARTTLSSFLG